MGEKEDFPVLGNLSIARELNKNIFIYPLNTANIKGASLNLTASKNAWSLATKQSIVDGDKIVIPKHDTALIETEEIVHVTSKIAGSYHSKVTLVSKGLGHIGTTLDPQWCGHSLIAIHNETDDPVEIACNDTFVSLTFFYVKGKSNSASQNHSGRTDILDKLGISYPNELNEDTSGDVVAIEKRCIKAEKESKAIESYLSPIDFHFWQKRNFWLIAIPVILLVVEFFFYAFTDQWFSDYTKEILVPILILYIGSISKFMVKA